MRQLYATLLLAFCCAPLAALYGQSTTRQFSAKKYTIRGYMRDSLSTESLIGATLYNRSDMLGTSSNQYGFYSLTLPEGWVDLVYSYVGYATQEHSFMLDRDTVLDVTMVGSLALEEVVVTARKSDRIQDRTQMSALSVPIAQVKAAPALLGEVDVLKVLQLMPGIQSGGEGSSGLYVRGGGPDQNLILLDGVPVYNASHLFGFFSVFNADAINNIELLKGGFPARHGGRVSSVIDISMKEGNIQQFHGEGSIGVVASRLTLEGPILKDRSSFIVSARRTYVDLLARPFIAAANTGSSQEITPGYYFYDINAKINHRISANDRIYLSAYMGDDKFYVESEDKDDDYYVTQSKSDMGLTWGNITGAFRWNHIFTNQLFGNTTLTYSRYRMDIYMKQWEKNSYENTEQYFGMDYLSGIEDWSGRVAFDYMPSPNHYIRFGGVFTHHTFNPGAIGVKATIDEMIPSFDFGGEKTRTQEYSLYAEDDVRLSDYLKVNGGLRWSAFGVRGKFYHALQPRLSARYLLTDELSVKAAYSRMAQYVHLLTNSNLGMPTDLWVPTTDVLRPQRSNQVAAGLACNFRSEYELSLESYYKTMSNVIEYKEGASVFDVHSQWEDKVLQGEGRSYGVEFFAQKKTGSITGWIGYTLSWSDRQFDALNNGKRFSYKYDRRHDVSVAVMKKFGKRVEASGTWVFGSGSCATIPVGIFNVIDPIYPSEEIGTGQVSVTEYSERNAYRMEPYHRLDLSVSLIKKKQLYERRWIFGVFNAYNRRNPYFVSVEKNSRYSYMPVDYYSSVLQQYDSGEQTRYRYRQVSLFPIIPSVSYQFKF
ncbi:MAG: TonB-dependent receptor [Prevotellaceae bacterium]|jgi:outer membrane receptor protein involved in Fe transport|nr:TonB-dependent receptor [Prevotellaceae bacterium]